jgi:hypothetical protein
MKTSFHTTEGLVSPSNSHNNSPIVPAGTPSTFPLANFQPTESVDFIDPSGLRDVTGGDVIMIGIEKENLSTDLLEDKDDDGMIGIKLKSWSHIHLRRRRRRATP